MATTMTKPYGDVTYADPGYQSDGKKRYPIDTADHARAAWSYINQADNASQYSDEQLSAIKARIMAACKRFGVDVGSSGHGGSGPGNSDGGMGRSQMRFRGGEMFVRAFDFESRSASDGRTLEGYAAVFNKPTRIADRQGDFDEVILPGAFTRSLERRTPVLQFEHGRDPRVGAVPIGAFEDIREDSTGLYVRAKLFDNPVVDPVRQAIQGKAIRGMSFRFAVPAGGDKWVQRSGDVELREIRDTDTAECGPVVFPAYDQTSVSVRSLLAQLDPDEYRVLLRELADELRGVLDLTGRPVARSAGGGDAAPQGAPTSTRARLDDESLRLRGIIQ